MDSVINGLKLKCLDEFVSYKRAAFCVFFYQLLLPLVSN